MPLRFAGYSGLSVTVVYATRRHTRLTLILTTASQLERAANSSRVQCEPLLCSATAVQRRHVTRQAAHVHSSCVSLLPPLLPPVAVSSLAVVVLASVSSVRPSRLPSSTSSLSVSLPVVLLAHPPPFAVGANLLVLAAVAVA